MSPTLPHARYIVLTHEGVWKINLNNTLQSRLMLAYETRLPALRALLFD